MSSPEKSLSGHRPQKSEKKKKSKKPKHKIKRVVIEPADNGGFMVRHEHQPDDMSPEDMSTGAMPPQAPPDETHALGGPDELQQHIGDTFGGQQAPPPSAGPQGSGGAGGM